MTQTHEAQVRYCRRLKAEGKTREFMIGMGYRSAAISEALGE